MKQEENESNYFPGWKLCLAYIYFSTVLNEREERSNNVGKTVVTFPHIFCEMLGALVRLIGVTEAETNEI